MSNPTPAPGLLTRSRKVALESLPSVKTPPKVYKLPTRKPTSSRDATILPNQDNRGPQPNLQEMFAVLQRWEKGCLETINDLHLHLDNNNGNTEALKKQLDCCAADKERLEKLLAAGNATIEEVNRKYEASTAHLERAAKEAEHLQQQLAEKDRKEKALVEELKNNSQVAEDYRFQLEAKQNFVNNAIQTIDELARRVRERDDELKQKGEEAVALRNKLVDAQQRVVNAQERAVEAEQAVRRERDQMHKLEATVKEGLSHWRTHYERQDQEDGRAAKRAKYIHWPND